MTDRREQKPPRPAQPPQQPPQQSRELNGWHEEPEEAKTRMAHFLGEYYTRLDLPPTLEQPEVSYSRQELRFALGDTGNILHKIKRSAINPFRVSTRYENGKPAEMHLEYQDETHQLNAYISGRALKDFLDYRS